MNYSSLLIIGFIVGLSGAVLPGPLLIYIISKALQGRMVNGVKIVFGHMLVEVVAIVLILLGLKEAIGSDIVSNILAIIGGLALIMVGLCIIFKATHMKLPIDTKINFSSGLITGGIFFTAFNPTFPTWWVVIGAPLLSKALLSGLIGVIMLTVGHWLADFAWYILISFTVVRGKLWLNDRSYQLILKTLAIILVGFGLWFIRHLS